MATDYLPFDLGVGYESHDFNEALNDVALTTHGQLENRHQIKNLLQKGISGILAEGARMPVQVMNKARAGIMTDVDDRPSVVAIIQGAVQQMLGPEFRVFDDGRAIDCSGDVGWKSSISLVLLRETNIPQQFDQCFVAVPCGVDGAHPTAHIPLRVKAEWWCEFPGDGPKKPTTKRRTARRKTTKKKATKKATKKKARKKATKRKARRA